MPFYKEEVIQETVLPRAYFQIYNKNIHHSSYVDGWVSHGVYVGITIKLKQYKRHNYKKPATPLCSNMWQNTKCMLKVGR